MAKTTITDLLSAGVHFGHQTRRWNPKMKPYVYGTRSGITIFDLGKTMQQLAQACDFLTDVASKGGQILFVGTKRQAQEIVRSTASRLGMSYMCKRWLGGTLTNQKVVMTRVAYMKKLQAQDADGTMDALPKKEVAGLHRELDKLQDALGGIADMRNLPAAIIVIDVEHERIAVLEAMKLGVPVVALVDSNCNPDKIDYVVPGNDDAVRSIKVIVNSLATAIEDGLNMCGKHFESRSEELTEEDVGKTDTETVDSDTASTDSDAASTDSDAASKDSDAASTDSDSTDSDTASKD